jgi:hypothetical protein
MRFDKHLMLAPALALLLGVSACDEGLTEVNRNPNLPEEVPVENLLAGAIRNLVAPSSQYGAFGYWSQFYNTELWAQHVAQSAYNDEDHYAPREGVNEAIWYTLYSSLLDLKQVQALATESDSPNLWAVAEIMSVYGWQVTTDMFGDIPYTEALRLDEGIHSPKYDAQAEIYSDLLRRLDAVSAGIDPGAKVTWASGDLIYQGDMQSWLEFANSLRLRIAMRMADTDRSDEAKAAFQAAWNADTFDDVGDAAELPWNNASVGPVNWMIVKAGRTDDFRVSKTVVDTLAHRNDPRLAVYANPAVTDQEYRGLPNGMKPSALGLTVSDFSTIGDYFVAPDAPSVLMSYSEMLFLGAEAAARGWIAADPAELYREGIRASMKQYGISDAAVSAYLAQPSVTYQGPESIGLQKWIALYLAGPEAFAEYRRTGVPDLKPSDGALQPVIPTRLPYPTNESLLNPEHFEPYEKVDLTVPVWWAQQ